MADPLVSFEAYLVQKIVLNLDLNKLHKYQTEWRKRPQYQLFLLTCSLLVNQASTIQLYSLTATDKQ